MAITGTYNTYLSFVTELYTASAGGTVFSANLAANAAFDLFTDTAVVNDAIYFANGANGAVHSDYVFNVGTAMAGTGIVLKWEYYKRGIGWVDLECLLDDTLGFTVLGTNRVKFPIQWKKYTVTVNGINRMWTRCRISALTTITEGGANSTNRVTFSNGTVTINGGTDLVPATFTDLYNWCIANIPYVTVGKRNDNSFDFTKIGFLFTGRCLTKNEVIEIGGDGPTSQGNGASSLEYVTSGIKAGTRGYAGSTYIVYGGSNSGVLVSGLNTRTYGSVFKPGKYWGDSLVFAGYLNILGEWIDNVVEQSISTPPVGAVMSNTRIVGSLLICSGVIGGFNTTTYICVGFQLFYVYFTGLIITDFAYQFIQATGIVFFIYQNSSQTSVEWILINPSITLPLLSNAIVPCYIATNSYSNFLAVKFYDTSAATYTDYTTQASSAIADDVPLDGDVGDYYLFCATAVLYVNSFSIDCTITNQVNDYVYAWEYYRSGTWISTNPTYVWDGTNNLSKTGKFSTAAPSNIAITTIDGVSGYWMRARIVTKGTGTPKASKLVQHNNSGVSGWSLKEKYSLDVKVTDRSAVNINGATVKAINQNGVELFSISTAPNGTITQQTIIYKEYHFDPINNPVTLISENIFNTFDLIVTKTGYENYSLIGITLGKKIDLVITLNTIVPMRRDVEGNIYKALKPELGSNVKIVKI